MRKCSLVAMFFMALSLFLSVAAQAGDEGLYPAAPPPGSAFVRFFNGNASPAQVSIRGKSYGAAQPGAISAYVPVPPGDAAVTLGTASGSAPLKEGAHYAAVLHKDKLTVLEEPGNDNKLKAEIVLINLSSAPSVSLKTADGSTDIVAPVNAGSLGGRAVNAVKAPFSIYSAGKKIEDLAALSLERGARYAVVIYDGVNGKPAVAVN